MVLCVELCVIVVVLSVNIGECFFDWMMNIAGGVC
jgi:hypothetical protein